MSSTRHYFNGSLALCSLQSPYVLFKISVSCLFVCVSLTLIMYEPVGGECDIFVMFEGLLYLYAQLPLRNLCKVLFHSLNLLKQQKEKTGDRHNAIDTCFM